MRRVLERPEETHGEALDAGCNERLDRGTRLWKVWWLIGTPVACLAAVLLLFAEQLRLQQGAFTANALTANTNTVTLTAARINDTAIVFQWPTVSYGPAVTVSYTVQLDKISDTSGATAWENAKSFSSAATTQPLLGTDLNNFATSAGFTPGVASPIAVRVISNVVQQNGSATPVPSSYSNTIVISLTPPPFPPYLYVPGAYQGWLPGSASTILQVPGKAGLYEGYENLAGAGIQYFKYTDAPDWDHTNYGDGGGGVFSTDGQAGGLSVPNGGYYELTANLLNNTWTATATTWGIIGDATPGGWDNDTPMSYDDVNQVWKVTANMKQNGSFKFRANNAWNIDFGIDNITDRTRIMREAVRKRFSLPFAVGCYRAENDGGDPFGIVEAGGVPAGRGIF